MALIKINNNNPTTAFFFNALFTAVTFAVILVFNDYVDDEFKDIKEKLSVPVKVTVHTLIILIFTFGLTYLFKYVFGWGNALIG